MKAKLKDGTIIECTPQEWLILQREGGIVLGKEEPLKKEELKKEEPKVVVVVEEAKPKPKVNLNYSDGRHRTWTPEQDKILVENAEKPSKKIMKLIPGKSAGAINCRLSMMHIKRNLKRTKAKREPMYGLSTEEREKRSKRMKWCNERAKYFVNTYQWSYEQARSAAAKEYDSKVFLKKENKGIKIDHQQQMTPFKDVEFPMISPLNTPEGSSQFESVLKNLFSRTNGSIGYYDIKWIHGVEWNGRVWHNFLINIFNTQKQIFDYFMIKGKLYIDKDGNGYEILRYDKESIRDQDGNIIRYE